MVTTTTKNLNYSITKGQHQNSVNATITSTSGFNGGYLGKLPGILKIFELILAAVSLGLIASLRQEQRLKVVFTNGTELIPPIPDNYESYPREMFLVGEVYFLCAHSAVLTCLVIFLMSYLFHTVSSMVVPKTSTVENWMNILLAVMLFVAGVVVLVLTVQWQYDQQRVHLLQPQDQFNTRIAAGAIAILNGLLFLVSFFVSHKELRGPEKTLG